MVHFEKTTSLRNGRYEVALPWKDGFELANNKQVTVTRLDKLVNRLDSRKGLLETYDRTIKDYLRAGHAEVVSDVPADVTKLYYMPHKEVILEQALTSEVRVVFHISSHTKGSKFFNYCLEKGDNMYQDLVQILLRFTKHPVAVIADIKAFLQIAIREGVKDALHFSGSQKKIHARASSKSGE
nr:uncharacterized protein LOC119165250 [Rhipicephalus microplus]